MKKNLTNAERAVLRSLADAWNSFAALDDHHPDDVAEFQASIHAAQDKLAARVARRVDPDFWRQPETAAVSPSPYRHVTTSDDPFGVRRPRTSPPARITGITSP